MRGKQRFGVLIGIIICGAGIFLHFFWEFPTWTFFFTLLAVGYIGQEDDACYVAWGVLIIIFLSVIIMAHLTEIIEAFSTLARRD